MSRNVNSSKHILKLIQSLQPNPTVKFDSSQEIKINVKFLAKTLSTTPFSATIDTEAYVELWRIFRHEVIQSVKNFQVVEEIFNVMNQKDHLKTNAYFYYSFVNIGISFSQMEKARSFLMKGVVNKAMPAEIMSSAFAQFSKMERSKNLQNKENVAQPTKETANIKIKKSESKNLKTENIFNLGEKNESNDSNYSIDSKEKTIETTVHTSTQLNMTEKSTSSSLSNIVYTTSQIKTGEKSENILQPPVEIALSDIKQNIQQPLISTNSIEKHEPNAINNDHELMQLKIQQISIDGKHFQSPLPKKPSVSEFKKVLQTPPTRKICPDENIYKLPPSNFKPTLQHDASSMEKIQHPSPTTEKCVKKELSSPMRKKKKLVHVKNGDSTLQFNSRIQLTDWMNHVIFVKKKNYLKLTRVGAGGSSKVYKVLQSDGNIYAIKQVALEKVDTSIKNSYLEEIQLLQRLQNSHGIIRLIDWELNSENLILNIVLEFGETDLSSILYKLGPLLHQGGENYLRMYWQQILEPVRVLHEQRIIHGDLKPHNFVSVKGQLKLIDFGIAKAIQTDTINIHTNNIMGTLNYLAPEILVISGDGKTKYGTASDIWSLGCIFYQMIYGKPPLHSYESVFAMKWLTDPLQNIQYKPNPRTNSPLPEIIISVLTQCLQKDPNARSTCYQLLNHPFLCPIHTTTNLNSVV